MWDQGLFVEIYPMSGEELGEEILEYQRTAHGVTLSTQLSRDGIEDLLSCFQDSWNISPQNVSNLL